MCSPVRAPCARQKEKEKERGGEEERERERERGGGGRRDGPLVEIREEATR